MSKKLEKCLYIRKGDKMKNTKLLIGELSEITTKEKIFTEIEESIKQDENIIILNNNETYYNRFIYDLNNNNYKSYILNLKDSSKSNGFNPLMLPYNYYKSGNFDKAIDLIEKIGLEICNEENQNVDPFWTNSAAALFTSLILILFKEGKTNQINIGSIQAMLSLGEKKIDDKTILTKYFDSLNIMDNIYITGSAIIYAPPETKGSIISVLKQKLNAYCMRNILLNNLCNNEIDLANINDKTAIFIIGEERLNSISNILIDQIFNQTAKFTYYLDSINNNKAIIELKKMMEENEKIYIIADNIKELENKYGKYTIEKITNVLNIESTNSELILEEKELPNTKIIDKEYFNFEEFIQGI